MPLTFDEPLPDETDKAYAAYLLYRDQDPSRRNLDEVSLHLYGRPGSSVVRNWSSRHSWRERSLSFDAWRDRQRLDALVATDVDVVEREARVSEVALRLVESSLAGYIRSEQARQHNIRVMTEAGELVPPEMLVPTLRPSDAARLLDVAAKVGRLARGAATSIVEQRHDVTRLSDEELRAEVIDVLADDPELAALVEST